MAMIDLIKRAIPRRGLLWRFSSDGYLSRLLEGLSEEPKRVKEFLKTVVQESNPGTAETMQEEWYQQYGLEYDDTKTIEQQQGETTERFTALGAQDIVYLQEQVNKAGFTDITLVENVPPPVEKNNVCGTAITGQSVCWNGGGYGGDWIFIFYVVGTVEDDSEFARLKTLLQKIVPAHLKIVYNVENRLRATEDGLDLRTTETGDYRIVE